MNLFQKYKRNLKRIGTLVLTASMIAQGLPGAGLMETKATVLEDNSSIRNQTVDDGREYGHSVNTAYVYGLADTNNSNGANNLIREEGYKNVTTQHTFNLSLKSSESSSKNGYHNAGNYKINFSTNHFQTRYMFAAPSDVSGTSAMTPKISYAGGLPSGVEFARLSSGGRGVFHYNNGYGGISAAKNGEVTKVFIPDASRNPTSQYIEVRQTIMPSEDDQYLLVEYTVHNPNATRVDFTIGNQTDTSLIGHDNAPIVITKQDDTEGSSYEGVHYHATKGATHVMSTFDIYTDMKPNKYGVGITRRDGNDKSRIGAWAGTWNVTKYGRQAVLTDYFTFSKLTDIGDSILMENGDSAVAFSAYFDLNGHETKTARFAIAAKEHVYYANGSLTSGLGTGYLGSPVKKDGNQSSIENALGKAGTDNSGNNKKPLYIMVQADEEIADTIEIPSGYEVTILSADYGAPGTPKTEEPEYDPRGGGPDPTYSKGNDSPSLMTKTVTLKRAANFTGPLFKVEAGATLDLTNIIIDGNKDGVAAHNAGIVDANGTLMPGKSESDIVYVNSPLIENAGDLIIGTGTTLQNADSSHTRSLVKTETTYITQTTSTDPATGTVTVNDVENPGFTYKDIPNANATKASAIYSTGRLTFKGGTIQNNVSADASSAASNTHDAALANAAVTASGAVVIDNPDPDAVALDSRSVIKITGNTTMRYTHTEHRNPDGSVSTKEMKRVVGGNSNLYLRNDAAVLKVKNSATTGMLNSQTSIGLRINNPPNTQNTGRLVVQRDPESGSMTFASGNFTSDAGSAQLLRMGQTGHKEYTGVAPDSDTGSDENSTRLYVKRLFGTITYNYMDENGSPITVSGMTGASETKTYGIGSNVRRSFGTYPNHKIDSVTVSPSDTDIELSSDKTSLLVKKLKSDVIVNIRYVKVSAKYTFDLMLNSGGETTDSNLTNITTTTSDADLKKYEEMVNTSATSSTISPPRPSRNGYEFLGWKRYRNVQTAGTMDRAFNPTASGGNGADVVLDLSPIASLTLPAPNAEREEYYYAVWKQNVLSVPLTRQITNNNTNPSISFETKNEAYSAGEALAIDLPYIPGYKHHANAAGKRIESTSFGSSYVNTDTNANHEEVYQFTGTMPSTSASLLFQYDVDTGTKFSFTVKHVDEQGNELHKADTTPYSSAQQVSAEARISSGKETIPGYTYHSVEITKGRTPDSGNFRLGLDSAGMLRSFHDGSNGTSNTGELEAFMPNQDVEVVYKYTDNNPSKPYRKIVIDDVTHAENGKTLLADKMTTTPGPNFPIASDTAYTQFYGLTYSQVLDLSTTGAVVDAQGNVGNYTQNSGGTLILGAKKGREWNHLKFGFVRNGFETNADIRYPNPGNDFVSILTTDQSALGNSRAMRFAVIRNEAAFPSVTMNPYYLFDGWFKDESGTAVLQDADVFTQNTTAPYEHKIYAKIIEDPSKWVDVNFVSSDPSVGTLAPVTTEGIYVPGATTQHLHFDATWNTVTKPIATPIANYELKGWIAPNGSRVGDLDAIQAGTYTAVFGKKDATWGLVVGAFGASGSIGSDGSGIVTVNNTTPGNVYIVTDPDGNIVGVANGNGTDLNFPNLVPGRTYQVIEGTPDTVAVAGNPASSITGGSLSDPKPVTIPAIGDNKSVGVDPGNPERAQIVINPADPDAEYALIDSNGNVVIYPGSDGGWMTPTGSGPATVTFNDLDPGETYTVVARKKGNASETPLGNLDAGVPVVANPGSMAQAKNYIIETKTNGIHADVKVLTVEGESVNSARYDLAKANSAFHISASPTDGAGNPFLYWGIMNGRIPGVSGKIHTADYSGQIAQSNVVFKAVYDVKPKNAAGENIAPVEQGNRGNAAEGEFALDPEILAQLENELDNDTDISLINVNGADVRYKVIFDKRTTRPAETDLIRQVPSEVWANYPEAFTGAWALDIKEERYVDGRLVQNASPSNAAVKVSVQLEAQDTDMLDYEIWDLGAFVDSGWNPVTPTLVSQLAFTEDVANNAGYLSFEGNLNHSYVLVYAKTFKLYFIDNNPALDHRYLGDTNRNFFQKIKVRKKDAVTSAEYSSDYRNVTDYADRDIAYALATPFDDIYGVTHSYVNWSKKDMPANVKVFDPDSEVTKTQNIFAYYNNNRTDVTQARKELTDLIPVAVNLRSDPYLKLADLDELNAAIADAQNVLDRVRGRLENGTDPLRMANYPELRAAIEALQRVIDRMNQNIQDRNAAYIRRTGGSSGGGTGSSGRGGGGASGTPLEGTNYKNLPLSADKQNTFTLGVDGNWKINPMTGRWSFVLNGGLPLNDKWARIDYVDSTGTQITDWYRFDLKSSLITGWHYDTEYKGWYYLNPADGKDIGKMVRGWHKEETTDKWYYLNKEWGSMATGWHHDPDDGRWYYLDPNTGEMAVGWHFINGAWYYFNTGNSAPTWSQVDGKWVYGHSDVRPFGSMYRNEATPDGYRVDANGAWIR